MTVAELILELTEICKEKGLDPYDVEIRKVVQTDDMWGEDWEYFRLDTAGGNEYPFVVLFK